MKLGQLLLHRGLIDRQQLRVALQRQDRTGLPLGEILLSMGIVSRADILGALRRQPHASVAGSLLERVSADVRGLIPASLGRRLVAVPVARAEDVLVVAMADPTDHAALEALRAASGLEIIGVVSDADDILATVAAGESSTPVHGTGTDG